MHTGNIIILNLVLQTSTVYPCAYREHFSTLGIRVNASGLSLCIQGTWYKHIRFNSSPRFIPVHTGNICYFLPLSVFSPVYPCAYREHFSTLGIRVNASGLSLCIQGTSTIKISLPKNFRFIPVHTGNIVIRVLFLTPKAVYPCAYREH